METDRLLLILSTVAFAAGLVHAVVALRAGKWAENRWHLVPMAVGLIFQTAFLFLRGERHGRCPLTNEFEVFIFIGWCIVLLYFAVGAAFRLSLLGVFTAPMVALLQAISLLLPLDVAARAPKSAPNALLELHAAVSLIAYAAFALACITGVMYLLQERLLKRHRISGLFYQLPPIRELGSAIRRLVTLGLSLLAIGLVISVSMRQPASHPKMIVAWAVLGLYSLIRFLMWRHLVSPRQIAWLAVSAFVLPFVSLWLVAGK